MSLSAWDDVNKRWVKVQADEDGKLIVVPGNAMGYGVGSKMMMDVQIATTQPDETTTFTTGAGAVRFTPKGAEVDAGAPAGDDASLYIHELGYLLQSATAGILKIEMLAGFQFEPSTKTMEIAIGLVFHGSVGTTSGVAYFDPRAGNVRVDATTDAIAYPALFQHLHWFRVEIDLDESETRFYIDDVLMSTIASVPVLKNDIGVVTTSTGQGNDVYIQYIRYSWEIS